MSARVKMLAAIRARLAEAARVPAEPTAHATAGAPDSLAALRAAAPGALLAAFRTQLEGVGGQVHLVASLDEAAALVQRLLAERGARRVAFSDAALVAQLRPRLHGVEAVPLTKEALLEAEAGITSAQHAIAETGTLVLASDAERHRLESLVPPLHIALLPRTCLVATLGDALAAARGRGPLPPSLTWITGPSRTGDIELTLVVGVHGPRELHVVVL